jgi:hypothetical protein
MINDAQIRNWARLFVAVTLASMTTALHANLVTWELDASFDDGGTAQGIFALDFEEEFVPLLGVSSWDIKTTAGHVLASEAEYTSALSAASAPLTLANYYSKESGTTVPIITFALADPTDPANPTKIRRYLIFTVRDDLTEDGGMVLIDSAQSDECFHGLAVVCRNVTAGSVTALTAVPEPSSVRAITIALLLLAPALAVNVRQQRSRDSK